jgi:hypothetical protein
MVCTLKAVRICRRNSECKFGAGEGNDSYRRCDSGASWRIAGIGQHGYGTVGAPGRRDCKGHGRKGRYDGGTTTTETTIENFIKERKMNRRNLLKYVTMAGAAQLAGVEVVSAAAATSGTGPVVLYCDLAVDPKREQEMLDHYHHDFKPAAEKFDGYIDVKMVKIRKVIQGGPAPSPGINYRFQLTYESEEKRQKWIASAIHMRVWPLVENTVLNRNYLVLLTDTV